MAAQHAPPRPATSSASLACAVHRSSALPAAGPCSCYLVALKEDRKYGKLAPIGWVGAPAAGCIPVMAGQPALSEAVERVAVVPLSCFLIRCVAMQRQQAAGAGLSRAALSRASAYAAQGRVRDSCVPGLCALSGRGVMRGHQA